MSCSIYVVSSETYVDYDNDMPVYDIQTDTMSWLGCNLSCLNQIETSIEEDEDIYITVPQKDCDMLEKVYSACSELADFEKASREQFLNLIKEKRFEDVIKYFKVKNDFVFHIQTDEFKDVITKVKAVKKVLESILRKKQNRALKVNPNQLFLSIL